MNRTPFALLLVLSAACSQRSPWQVIPAPSPTSGATTAATTTPARAASAARPPALSMAAAAPRAAAPADATAVAHLNSLLFPVAGVDSTRLDDSFDAPRDGGARTHNAIDIMAPRGTPVLAAADGRVLRLHRNAKGGLTVYATDLENRFIYYYAHFDRYHPRVYAGKPLMRGDTLGFVGTTGNAPKDLPHLHFQVMRMPDDGKYLNGGEPINPFPLLRAATDQ